MDLTKKKIESAESISIRLKHAREMQNFSLRQVADQLKMNKEHIELIESNQFERLPFASIYQKKLVGNYAEIVGLEKYTLMKQFEIEKRITTQKSVHILLTPHKKQKSWRLNFPTLFRTGTITLSTILLLGYLGYQVTQIVKPPELTLISPLDGAITQSEAVDVKGKTEKEVRVLINGKEVKRDEHGIFDESIPLTQGVNTIVISATTKHNKTTTLTRYVIAQKENQFSLGQNAKKTN